MSKHKPLNPFSYSLPPELVVPVPNAVCIASTSGGKDSTAVVLALREAGIEARYAFADTGWEHPLTYEYLDTLERILSIKIERVHAVDKDGNKVGMRELILERAGFPTRMQRWCTRQLKMEPLQAFHDRVADETDGDTISVVGIRAQESQRRAEMKVFEHSDGGTSRARSWRGYVWRPIHDWKIEDVLAIHHRHGVPVNPLYKLNFGRVGCWPCFPYANKDDIRLWADADPRGVAMLKELEEQCGDIRKARNVEKPGRYKWEDDATAFQAREAKEPTPDDPPGRNYVPMDVDQTVAWSRTSRGGKQVILLRTEDTGCAAWGMCDPPSRPSDPDERT